MTMKCCSCGETPTLSRDVEELRNAQWVRIGGLVGNFQFPKKKKRKASAKQKNVFFV